MDAIFAPASYLYRMFYYQADKLLGGVGCTETIWNKTAMQGHKCRSCEEWSNETKKKYRNSNALVGKHFVRKIVTKSL